MKDTLYQLDFPVSFKEVDKQKGRLQPLTFFLLNIDFRIELFLFRKGKEAELELKKLRQEN